MCVAIALTDPAVAELMSLLGFDCLWLDLEHHPRSLETGANLMRASRVGGADIIARPAKGEFLRMGRMLEAGATVIMYPRCDHEDEAAEVVRSAKFAPMGSRGMDGGGPDMPYCSMSLPAYIAAANRETFVFVQIEDPKALERVEKIAAVPGVDGIFFGPGDFSVLAGIPEQFNHPLILNAQERIGALTKAVGKRLGNARARPRSRRQDPHDGRELDRLGNGHRVPQGRLRADPETVRPSRIHVRQQARRRRIDDYLSLELC